MVTTYNEKDMTSFGNYLLQLVNKGMKTTGPDGNFVVTHADFQNWKVGEKIKKKESKVLHPGAIVTFIPSESGNIDSAVRNRKSDNVPAMIIAAHEDYLNLVIFGNGSVLFLDGVRRLPEVDRNPEVGYWDIK